MTPTATPLPQPTREPLTREPLEPTRERTASDVLLAAARYIEEHGWTQGHYSERDGRVCAVGALYAVSSWLPYGIRARRQATNKASWFVGESIIAWQDTPGRTEAEVIAALRAAAVSS